MENIGVDAAKLAGLQIDFFQKFRNGQITIDHFEWFNNLTKYERDNFLLGRNTQVKKSVRIKQDDRFELIKTIELIVPADYVHTRLDQFRKANREIFYGYNDAITDKNFARVTDRLVPGQSGKVKIFQIKKRVSSLDCLNKLKEEKAILVGAQGASLVWELKREELPIGKWSVSFDEKEALWRVGDGRHRVPNFYRFSDGDFSFNLGRFEGVWGDDACLLCFCDFQPSNA